MKLTTYKLLVSTRIGDNFVLGGSDINLDLEQAKLYAKRGIISLNKKVDISKVITRKESLTKEFKKDQKESSGTNLPPLSK